MQIYWLYILGKKGMYWIVFLGKKTILRKRAEKEERIGDWEVCDFQGFSGGTSGKEPACQCRRKRCGLIPEPGTSPGGGHGNPLQYSCVENPHDRGGWRAAVHGVAESDTTKQLSTHRETQTKARRYHLKWLLSEWLLSKSLQIAKVSEHVGKRNSLYTAGGNVNWCSHRGKQYGSFSKN